MTRNNLARRNAFVPRKAANPCHSERSRNSTPGEAEGRGRQIPHDSLDATCSTIPFPKTPVRILSSLQRLQKVNLPVLAMRHRRRHTDIMNSFNIEIGFSTIPPAGSPFGRVNRHASPARPGLAGLKMPVPVETQSSSINPNQTIRGRGFLMHPVVPIPPIIPIHPIAAIPPKAG